MNNSAGCPPEKQQGYRKENCLTMPILETGNRKPPILLLAQPPGIFQNLISV
jgi:hypothetical protein